MKVLHLGGTGIISSACVDESIRAGHDVWVLNRGRSSLVTSVPPDRQLVADVYDVAAVRDVVWGHNFDVVVQWKAFTAEHVRNDVETFADVGQYVFISSASAYQKPPQHWLTTEATPLENPFWQYSRDKIAAEAALAEAAASNGFRYTTIRPSLTYGINQVPVSIGSWEHPFTIVQRMRHGKAVIVPGDGTNLWTITHNSDFARGLVPLFGRPEALGEAFHITSDEALTWNEIYRCVADAAGVLLDVVHVPTDALVAANPDLLGTLWGDKSNSALFTTEKLRTLVPDFKARVPFAEGIRETIGWFDAEEGRRSIAPGFDAWCDRVVAIYHDALVSAADVAST